MEEPVCETEKLKLEPVNEKSQTLLDNHLIKEEIPDLDIQEISENKEKHSCELCKEKFSSNKAFTIHNTSHHEHTNNICDESSANDEEFSIVSEHQECDKVKLEPHNISSVYFSCGKCYEIFKSSDALKTHQKLCCKESYQCPTCKKLFAHQCSLNRHELTHNKHKPYQCKICNGGFTQPSALKKHIQIQHNKIKPHTCDICGRKFSEKTDLNVHLRNHSGEKPFPCLVCNNSFTSLRNLKRHGRVHQKGTHNPCGICGKAFSTETKLGMHFLIHTDERPYRCELCDRGFTYSSHLKRHLLCHQKNNGL
ncbi:hypothetical protein JTE90_009199 [Oedothorax gibbosus]|uniref:C2H2-type domain-containing protein n=1 Tax=Oedothorax gibbosus TaxID=931172 RepID=A0AAV6UWV7_9ARAC|nr:hypothetical protein JTE90_009199 [Oedothorax gibbosus]